MSPQWRGGGGGGGGGGREGRSNRKAGTGAPTEEEKLTEPRFEGYLKGSWWEVDIKEERGNKYLIEFLDLKEEDASWYPLDELRLRARRCDDWDCGILRRGMDVSVYYFHPEAEFVKPPTPMALYDAQIVSVTKSKHRLDCSCKFSVQFYSIKEDNLKRGLDRKLVKNDSGKEVSISKLSILQQPGFIPLHTTLAAHIGNKWDSKAGHRWTNDAYFLKESELILLKKPSGGEESMTTPRSDPPPDVSEDVLTNPGGRLGTRNGQHTGSSKAFKSPVLEKNWLGTGRVASAQKCSNRKVNEVDHRMKKSPPMVNSKYPDRGVKRKHDSEEERDMDKDDSPEVGSSRYFARSKDIGGGESRRQDQNVGHRARCTGHETVQKVGGPVDPNRRRRIQIEETETSIENIPESSEDLIVDSGDNSERGSNRDVFLKRGRREEEPVKVQKHREYHNSRYDSQKASEQLLRGKSYKTSKQGKCPDPYTARQWPSEDAEPGRFSTQKAEKGSRAGRDLKVDKLDDDKSGLRRGRSKKPDCEWVEKEMPIKMKENVARSKPAIDSKFKRRGSTDNFDSPNNLNSVGGREEAKPAIDSKFKRRGFTDNFDSPNNLNTVGGREEVEMGEEMRRETKGKQVKSPETRRSSERLQKVSPGMPVPKKKEPEKGDNDPGFAKTEVELSSSNSEDPASGRRKLRSRTSLKSKKSPSAIQRDAEKDRSVKEKVPPRPLYLDLVVETDKEDDDSDKLCPTKQQRPECGLKDTWNPIVEDISSDSDCNVVSEKDTPVQTAWPDEFDRPPAVATEQAVPVVSKDDAQRTVHEVDGDLEERCDHKIFFKDDMGEVCANCGLVVVPIEDVVPQVEIVQRRPQAELDEWDFDKNSPDVNQGVVGYDQTKRGEVVTMLDTCLPPHYAKQMHPHQKEGFEFLWRNLGLDAEGNLKNKKTDKNAGCILSHAPGTGKSFLIIAFLKSFMDKFPNKRALIVAPKIMLLRWQKEFERWKSDIRVFILNEATQNGKRLVQKHEDLGLINFKGRPQSTQKQMLDNYRMAYLYEWKDKRSVCLVSYNLFSALTDDINRSLEGDMVRRSLLESPGLLILDEGHFPRNKDTRIRKALMKVKTNARILLSGTLFQNNFEELFNTFFLVRPWFIFSSELGLSPDMLGCKDYLAMEKVPEAAEKMARKHFVEEIGSKILEGQRCQGSEGQKHAIQRLQRLTANFVHHHTGEVLASLPGLRDFGILLKPPTLQASLLEIVEQRYQRPEEYLKRETAVSQTSIHPKLLQKLEFKDDFYKSLGAGTRKELAKVGDPRDGVKTKFVFDLLWSLKSSSEKVLIFSQHLGPLEMLEDMFKANFNWDKNKDVLRLDGTMAMNDREAIIERFNDASNQAKVLLASTKACGEGITLVGASRVVFLDVLWNPAVIKQAISRAFRLGQKKVVYVYRLIAIATIEEKKYKKAIRKDWLSMSIFSPASGDSDEQTGKGEEQTGLVLDPPDNTCSKNQSPGEEIHAWEVDASTCEDALLEKLLKDDKSKANAFIKVVEHGSRFHNRKTPCGPDAREWFLEDWDYKDLSHTKETMDGEEGLEENTNERLASKLYQDYEDDGGIVSSSDTDEEIL